MKKDKPDSPDFSELRRQAEERFSAKQPDSSQPPGSVEKLLHELQVHQIELELQNEELRSALQQIEESHAKYSDLYDFAPVGYLTLDEKGRILEANLTSSRLLGLDRSSFINTLFSVYISSSDRGPFRLHLDKVFKDKERQTCEVVLKLKGRGDLDVLLDSIFIQDVHGKVSCRMSVIDNTARKQAERELHQVMEQERERAQMLETVLQAVPAYVWIAHDPKCLHITGNRAADEFLRLPYGAETSLTAPEKVRPRQFKLFKDGREMMSDELPVQQAARGIVLNNLEYDVAFSDGTICHVLGNARPLLDGQGRPRGSVAAFVDITERKRMEDVIRHAHGELEERVRERTAEVVRANAQLSREILERQQSQAALQVERDNFRKLSQEFHTLLNAINDTLVQNVML